MNWTDKQRDFLKNATRRWNIKCGATRSGKTYLDYFVIPKRIKAVRNLDGLIVILGNTKGTLQRNVIEPMQKIWGAELVGDIKQDNTARMFGEKVYCLGADKITQVDRLRGSSIKYCYGDEIVSWSEEVFNMLKSRLDKDYSKFDGTCNPSYPDHWLKKFVDNKGEKKADIFYQRYNLYDNAFLSPAVVTALENEHQGVYHKRYILGEWERAKGAIFRLFAENPDNYKFDKEQKFITINIGLDFGGTKSEHALVATGITQNYRELVVLKSERLTAKNTLPTDVDDFVVNFTGKIIEKYGFVHNIFYDNAESVLGRGVKQAVQKIYNVSVHKCKKEPINERINLISRLIGLERLKYIGGKDCDTFISALSEQVWNDKNNDVRLDDGTTDVDTCDAFDYSYCREFYRLGR
jgi:PBSX family phage terminase large subunit